VKTRAAADAAQEQGGWVVRTGEPAGLGGGGAQLSRRRRGSAWHGGPVPLSTAGSHDCGRQPTPTPAQPPPAAKLVPACVWDLCMRVCVRVSRRLCLGSVYARVRARVAQRGSPRLPTRA
jgi:hypothetical protein